MMLPNVYEASSFADLRNIFAALKICVPVQRGEKRKNAAEWWCVGNALQRLPFLERVGDCHLRKSERPDFLLEIGNKCIGIEITEAIPPALADLRQAMQEYDGIYDPSIALLDGKSGPISKLKRNKKVAALNERPDTAWIGSIPEEHLAKLLHETIKAKIDKGYRNERIHEVHLIVYENAFGKLATTSSAVKLLNVNYSKDWNDFDGIWLLTSDGTALLSIP